MYGQGGQGGGLPADLVGRPLVPFFDEGEVVNEQLATKQSSRENMQVDARVWNPEGYFEYPEQHGQQSHVQEGPPGGTLSIWLLSQVSKELY